MERPVRCITTSNKGDETERNVLRKLVRKVVCMFGFIANMDAVARAQTLEHSQIRLWN